jgi:hypothetical protein
VSRIHTFQRARVVSARIGGRLDDWLGVLHIGKYSMSRKKIRISCHFLQTPLSLLNSDTTK